ncbi:ATP-binding cassette domain-containing protein [Oribacterium sp. WCC10]|uniref:ATP-binding cassette domain-containing protein n=1 Tax=Oribacterium sp. WCC10 TaxID=1855343 RepID=UPI0008E1C340|nr:ATP-binding cassette domain-containing protein [Oribacterium sp. WCC10]SFG06080.1 NHLM bacteriocin system ABC transporter, ATP-binding protein [Oribacterium sp. WCC10]
MGLLDNQIKARRKNDNDAMEKALEELRAAVLGEELFFQSKGSKEDALKEILLYYGVNCEEPPRMLESFEDRMNYMLSPTGIMKRHVKLSKDWWVHDANPILAYTKNGGALALLPKNFGGYRWYDYKSGKYIKAGRSNVDIFTGDAIIFYRPMPVKKMTLMDYFKYIVKEIRVYRIIYFIILSMMVSLIGLATPVFTKVIFNSVIPMENGRALMVIAASFLGMLVSAMLIKLGKALSLRTIQRKAEIASEGGIMGRVLNLPVSFFEEHNSGEMQRRIMAGKEIVDTAINIALAAIVGAVLAVIYLFQIMVMVPKLFPVTMAIVAIQLFVFVLIAWIQQDCNYVLLEVKSKINGLTYQLFSGIQKIKLAGAEKRAFAKWAKLFKMESDCNYNAPTITTLPVVLEEFIVLAGTVVLCVSAVEQKLSEADFMSFYAAFSLFQASFSALISVEGEICMIGPLSRELKPILEAVPEVGESKKPLARMTGGIELSNVSFRYTEDGPLVLKEINLKILPGQYIAIVGHTGCGKSTLIRLLLGFEKPTEGGIYYDGRDLDSIDLKRLRRNIGVVMQDAHLFAGTIFSNISIACPGLTMKEAWKAAEMADIADDIRAMPLGMMTLISESGGTISGGQRQRLMIAQAIACKPKILMFDEATSALDNISQDQIAESLSGLKCTRLVIAHRLSTIKKCNRIIVLDKGEIVEDGKYEELLEKGGLFADLIRRQRVYI